MIIVCLSVWGVELDGFFLIWGEALVSDRVKGEFSEHVNLVLLDQRYSLQESSTFQTLRREPAR